MPRYVILEHTGTATYKPGCHWDLMLEVDQSLRTWELDRAPATGGSILARQLPAHRLEYLDYEGPVSNDRGTVRQWDCGLYECLRDTADQLVVEVNGRELQSRLSLTRDSADPQLWHITVERAEVT